MTEGRGLFRRILAGLWNGVTQARLIASNLLFLLVLVFLFLLFSGDEVEPLPKQAALVLNPVGQIVEQKTYTDPYALLFSRPLPSEREVLLRDVLDAIAYAREDPSITALVMELDQLYGVGIPGVGKSLPRWMIFVIAGSL